jgi:hypothetical protein
VVTDVCVAFPTLSAIAEGFEVFVVTDSSGTFNTTVQQAAWARMSARCAPAELVRRGVRAAGRLAQRHGRPGASAVERLPNYRNLINSYTKFTAK